MCKQSSKHESPVINQSVKPKYIAFTSAVEEKPKKMPSTGYTTFVRELYCGYNFHFFFESVCQQTYNDRFLRTVSTGQTSSKFSLCITKGCTKKWSKIHPLALFLFLTWNFNVLSGLACVVHYKIFVFRLAASNPSFSQLTGTIQVAKTQFYTYTTKVSSKTGYFSVM